MQVFINLYHPGMILIQMFAKGMRTGPFASPPTLDDRPALLLNTHGIPNYISTRKKKQKRNIINPSRLGLGADNEFS